MATSGTTDFNSTRDEIIRRALRIVGATPQGSTPSATEVTNAAEALNVFVKTLQNQGINLWALDQITQTLTASSTVSGYRCYKPHTSSASDEPGVGANWSTYWKSDSTATGTWAGSTAYTAINSFNLPSGYIGISKAWVRENEIDQPIDVISRMDYVLISDKTSTGTPDLLSVERSFNNGEVFTVNLYPVPEDTDMIIHMLAVRTLEDFDADTDNPDFPVRWLNVLTFGLAVELSHEYSLQLPERQYLRSEYQRHYLAAKGDDQERVQRFVEPCFPVSYAGKSV
ncbi:hypothetical protein N9937_02145 [bacterium]|nr:hypothetical protein [bacterium]